MSLVCSGAPALTSITVQKTNTMAQIPINKAYVRSFMIRTQLRRRAIVAVGGLLNRRDNNDTRD
jgi:hypothetical protein